MRHPDQNGTMRRRAMIRGHCIAAMTLGMLCAQPAYSQNSGQNLQQIQQQIEGAQKKQDNLTFQRDLLNLEIKSLKKDLVSTARRITRVDTDLTDLEERLKDLKHVEKNTTDDLDRREDELAGTLSAMVRLNRRPDATLLGSSGSLMDSLRAAKIMHKLIPHLENESVQLAEQLQTLAALRTEHHKELQSFATLKASREQDQAMLNNLITSKQNVGRKVMRDQKKMDQKIASLGRQAKSLTGLVRNLEIEKKQRQKAEKRKQKADKRAKQAMVKLTPPKVKTAKSATAPQRSAAVRDNLGTGRLFSSVKGRLPLPVSGRIIAKYGKSTESGRKKGIVIETRPQAAVFSPYDGQIAFAGSFRHYGLLLIIDHGEGYHTLLAGMREINGSVGQYLLTGEPVGQMDINETQKPTLYMELRRKGSPINPHPWLAAGIGKVSG